MKGIFYNSTKALCSIWESGKACYDVLKNSTLFNLDYTEEKIFREEYDFAIVNEHFVVNNWINKDMVDNFKKPIFCIVTEVGFENCICSSPNFYTGYLVLDPSISEKGNIYPFVRPLENIDIKNNMNICDYKNYHVPIIGSFGMPTRGKDWNKIISQVENEFDDALIRFNIPYGTHIPPGLYNEVVNNIRRNSNKPGIRIEITHNNYTKEELIEWCSKNTINVFFYFRSSNYGLFGAGLSAVTDQAIVSERPLLVTDDVTFRHVHRYLNFYPNISIRDAINCTLDGVKKMKNDWSSSAFINKFESILKHYLRI